MIRKVSHTAARNDPDRQAGKLLAALRKRAGVTQDQLAGTINIGRKTLSLWENGHNPIATARLPSIATALRLSQQDLDRLTLARWPAVDAQSLSGQEQDKQAGKLLAALRKRAGITQHQLAGTINITKTTLSLWENGHNPIATAKLPFIATALSLSPQDLDRLMCSRWSTGGTDASPTPLPSTGDERQEQST
jgi:transcriptional regulator with XRE-family HTH domain